MSTGRQTILVVDDDIINVQAIVPLLLDLDIDLDINTSTDGMEAVKLAEELMPDLILLDILMPGISGYDVCQQLKEGEQTKSIPIIFLTAQNNTYNIVHGFEIGGVDYICKPYKKAELQSRVKTQLKLQQALKELKVEIGTRKSHEEELEKTLGKLRESLKVNSELKQLLPMCSQCKKIRNDDGYWKQVEEYFSDNSSLSFSHTLCIECARELYPDIADRVIDRLNLEKGA